MKKLFIIGNWKANKTVEETRIWLEEIKKFFDTKPNYGNKEIVVCPPFIHLGLILNFVHEHNLPIGLGVQDLSQFGRGAYTGEIPGSIAHEFAGYCIIGHSERRRYFHEDDNTVAKKFEMAKSSMLQPIICVQDQNTPLPRNTIFIAYEPVFAIGTGTADTPENAEKVASQIKKQNKGDLEYQYVLYGGSVTGENVNSFTKMPSIDGVLVGGASLDPKKFIDLIKNA
jgi:triosephosphate isomerase